jgi:hypothetical protein
MDLGHTWKGMTAQVTHFIKRCPTCNSSRLPLKHAPVSAATLRLFSRPLKRWHIDQTGAIGDCAFTGFSCFISFICETTGYTLLFGSRFGTSLEMAIAMISVMSTYGLAEAIHTDGGSENDSFLIHQFTQLTGIRHSFSIPRLPHSNGIAERNIGLAKRFLRSLCVDIGKHNGWGLLLPIAQKGLNDLKREELSWLSPNDIVFASINPIREEFVIPTFYGRRITQSDLADANHYNPSANFMHRAVYFQQSVINALHDKRASDLESATSKDPTEASDLQIGQLVLIDWPNPGPPSQQHPKRRGPYSVISLRRNVVRLRHLYDPPPADQSLEVLWSKHAFVYVYFAMQPHDRSPLDPTSSSVSVSTPSRHIDCVLSHTMKPSIDVEHAQPCQLHHVSNQLYQCRLWCPNSTLSSAPLLTRTFPYDDICHTYAFDSYAIATPALTGHRPIAMMPANWDPHAPSKALRPSHRPLPAREYAFRSDSDTSDIASDSL